VLSARATEILIRGVLRTAEEDRPTRIADYMELIRWLADRRLPPSFGRFLESLVGLVAPADLNLVAGEVQELVLGGPENDPRASSARVRPGLGPGIGALIPTGSSEIRIVLDSDLPPEVKEGLVELMAQRREEMETALRREAVTLVRAVRYAARLAEEATSSSKRTDLMRDAGSAVEA